MTVLDKITEEIAHFIGFFHMSVEEARLRDAYQEFFYDPADSDVQPFPVIHAEFAAPYEFLGFEPDLAYRSPGPELWPAHGKAAGLNDAPVYESFNAKASGEGSVNLPEHIAGSSPSAARFTPSELEVPGSVVNHFHQAIALSDDDYVSVGGHGLVFTPPPIDDADLLEGADQAASLSPLEDLERPGSSEEIVAVIETAIDQLEEATGDGEHVQVLVSGEVIEGVHVDGELIDEAPDLEDYHKFDDGEAETVSHSNTWTTEDGTASVEIEAGGNTLVNNAVLKNFWTGGTVTAVVGDHIEVNAIVQTNALWDADAITPSVDNWGCDGSNELFNIATFERLDGSGGTGNSAGDDGYDGYPAFWSVAEIQGDLMITNWLEQFIFMSDNDVGVFSSSGVTTSVVAGDNLGLNHASVFELGLAFDLIIVGGSIYDANIIHQMNTLFDNDVVVAAGGFQTTGEGTISTSGNLLWNQASIGTIGDAGRFESLPQDYLDTANAFADGSRDLPGSVRSDDAFVGSQGLRVLYISGDLLNLQYIRQTNILGDNDQIALAMDALIPHLDASWAVSTGSNALLNNATIVDLDSFGKTYVGGEQYSQETLYQAELISRQPDFGNPDPDALVSEAVLFLDDSMLAPADHAAESAMYMPAEYDGHANDGVNNMIGH